MIDNQLIIIKIGGNVVDNPLVLSQVLDDFAKIPQRKILVHGGGKIADVLLKKLNIEPQKIEGRRITGVGYQVQYAIDAEVAGTWKAGYKPFGLAMGPKASDMTVCGATPEMKTKIDAIKKDIESGKIKVLEG